MNTPHERIEGEEVEKQWERAGDKRNVLDGRRDQVNTKEIGDNQT